MKNLLSSIDSGLGRIFDRIIENCMVGTLQLAYFRIFIGLFFLSIFMPSWEWLGNVPQGFFSPHYFSIANLFDSFPPKIFFLILDVVIILLFGLVTLGIYTRISLLAIFLLCCFGYNFSYSFGKIDHGTTLFLFAILTLVFTNCGNKLALVKDKPLPIKLQKYALAGLGIIISFGLFTAGLPKLIIWIDFNLDNNGFLSWFYPGYYMFDRQYLLANTVFNMPYFSFEIADYLAAVMEVCSVLFLLAGRRAWRIYIIILCVFHLLNVLILNIPFTLNVAAYGIFIISPILHWLRLKLFPINFQIKWTLFWVTTLLVVFQLGKKIFISDNIYTADDYELKFIVDNYLSIIVMFLAIISGYIVVKKRFYEINE